MPYALTVGTMIARANSDGSTTFIPADPASSDYQAYSAWLAAGNAPAPAPVQPPPVPSCLLWQLEAVCNAPPPSLGFTPPTWAAISAIIAALGNAAVTAFFNVGTNPIPANSTTLLAIADAASAGMTAAQLTTLVETASAVSIS